MPIARFWIWRGKRGGFADGITPWWIQKHTLYSQPSLPAGAPLFHHPSRCFREPYHTYNTHIVSLCYSLILWKMGQWAGKCTVVGLTQIFIGNITLHFHFLDKKNATQCKIKTLNKHHTKYQETLVFFAFFLVTNFESQWIILQTNFF